MFMLQSQPKRNILHPATILFVGAGIPFDFAQGKRDKLTGCALKAAFQQS